MHKYHEVLHTTSNLTMWAFHSKKDSVISSSMDEKMYELLLTATDGHPVGTESMQFSLADEGAL